MKPLTSRDPFRIGLAAIAVGAVLGLLIVAFTFIPFGSKTYTAYLAQTAGLRAGESVTVHGVEVGEVTSIELAEDRVKIRFTVDKDVKLGRSTRAEVKVATLLGTHSLAVIPDGGGTLNSIPLSRTEVPYNLQDVLERGAGSIEELDPVLLAKALTEASKALDATNENLGPALTGVARLSEIVQARSGQIGTLLQAARSVTDQLAASTDDVVTLMMQANLVIDEINNRRAAIRSLLIETTRLAQNISGLISDTRADLGPAFDQLNQVVAILNRQDKTLKGLIRVLGPAVRYVANATGSGRWANLWAQGPAIPPDDVRCRLSGGCR